MSERTQCTFAFSFTFLIRNLLAKYVYIACVEVNARDGKRWDLQVYSSPRDVGYGWATLLQLDIFVISSTRPVQGFRPIPESAIEVASRGMLKWVRCSVLSTAENTEIRKSNETKMTLNPPALRSEEGKDVVVV